MIAALRARVKRAVDRLNEVFGRGVVLTVTLLLLIGLAPPWRRGAERVDDRQRP